MKDPTRNLAERIARITRMVAGLGDLLLESIHRVLNLSCFSGTVRDLKLEFSRLDKYDTARGAAILMRNQLLRN